MLRVNYLGSVYCTKAVVDSMKQRRFGRIAFTSSQGGQLGMLFSINVYFVFYAKKYQKSRCVL